MTRPRLATFLLGCFTATAGDSDAQPARERAVALTGVSPAHCLASNTSGTPADPLRCPGALRTAVAAAAATCRDAGGRLEGAEEGIVWALDVDDDGRNELAFELDGNVSCVDAWSVFSCGSLGCPKALYELRGGEWTVIGGLWAEAPEDVVLGTAGRERHRAIEVCDRDGCPVRSIYEWQGETYEATRLEVRGTPVDVAGSIHGLHPLAVETAVRATPDDSAEALDRYPAGTEVAVVGAAEGGDWYYVSPCNSCDSGFVPGTALALP